MIAPGCVQLRVVGETLGVGLPTVPRPITVEDILNRLAVVSGSVPDPLAQVIVNLGSGVLEGGTVAHLAVDQVLIELRQRFGAFDMQNLARPRQRAARQARGQCVEVILITRVIRQGGVGEKVVVGLEASGGGSILATMTLPVTIEHIEPVLVVLIGIGQRVAGTVKEGILGIVDGCL